VFSTLFFTETFGTDKGLGFFITDCWMRLDYPLMYFGIILLSLSGLGMFLMVDIADRYFCRWRGEDR
jgi:NitT/TauT family transport system permease protein